MSNPNLVPDDPFDPPRNRNGMWLFGTALLALVVVGGLIYGWFGTNNAPSVASNGVSGQASSATGSTTAGAPAGTPSSTITGQATSPSGSTTTGPDVKR